MKLTRPDLRGDIYYHIASDLARKQLFYIHSVGDFNCREGYRVQRGGLTGGPFHPTCQLIYTVNGAGYVEYRNTTSTVRQGDIAVMNCREPNAYGISGASDWHKLWIHFDGVNSQALIGTILSRYGSVLTLKKGSSIPDRMNLIISTFRKPEPISEPQMSACIYEILMELLTEPSEAVPYGDSHISTALKAVSFIEGNLDGRISVEHLARTSGLSISHFSRLFKAEMGCSPREFIIDTKIDRARKLLVTTDMTVKEISAILGFRYESHFVSLFKRRTGISPRQFKIRPMPESQKNTEGATPTAAPSGENLI